MVQELGIAETIESIGAMQASKPWVARFWMARVARTILTVGILSSLKLGKSSQSCAPELQVPWTQQEWS